MLQINNDNTAPFPLRIELVVVTDMWNPDDVAGAAQNVVARGGAGWCGALVGARSRGVSRGLAPRPARASTALSPGGRVVSRNVASSLGERSSTGRCGVVWGPCGCQVTRRVERPDPPPRSCVHRAVVWWEGGPPKCSELSGGEIKHGVVRGGVGPLWVPGLSTRHRGSNTVKIVPVPGILSTCT